ncbi:SDR family oxidoreductase [Prauserella cavernicola]|uniref:SDR family oxidoreductase n=1 Tax=Prauserella cavernicola TaxID=2800127 RepID=A0A934V680_9PSEU|nr:SDR family oxidoreductase [Prauserella cavernicola]MBK1787257.1 SDR family oxidoreductase [Prauserella cavernicola]
MSSGRGPLDGKGAIVTGGSRGIGAAIVRRLAGDGAAVVFSYLKNDAAAQAVVDDVESAGGTAWAVQADQVSPDAIENLFAEADRRFAAASTGLEILVNNAGIAVPQTIEAVTVDDFDHTMAVNARGPFLAMQHAARRLRDGGRIVNVSTVSTTKAGAGEGLYAASKATLEQFTRSASYELGARGITVNTVSPGITETDLVHQNAADGALAGIARVTPLGRLGRPPDIAAVVAFLVGPDGAWVTGQNLRADGGLY